jgi:hypothetical protein
MRYPVPYIKYPRQEKKYRIFASMGEYLQVYPDQQTPISSHNQPYNMQPYLTQLRPCRTDLPTSNRSLLIREAKTKVEQSCLISSCQVERNIVSSTQIILSSMLFRSRNVPHLHPPPWRFQQFYITFCT